MQEILGAFAAGGSLVIVAPGGEKDTQHMAHLCKKHSVTCLCLVASLLEALLRVRPHLASFVLRVRHPPRMCEASKCCHDAQEPEFRACARLRSVICGGEAMQIPLVKQFASLLPHARLFNDYGPTEVTVASTGARIV